jgi:hypothetical protein
VRTATTPMHIEVFVPLVDCVRTMTMYAIGQHF